MTLPWGFTPSVSYNYNRREDEEGDEIGGYPKHAAFIKLLWANTRLGLRANIRGQVYGQTLPAFDGIVSARVSGVVRAGAQAHRVQRAARDQRLRAGFESVRQARHLPPFRSRRSDTRRLHRLHRAPHVPGRTDPRPRLDAMRMRTCPATTLPGASGALGRGDRHPVRTLGVDSKPTTRPHIASYAG